MVAGIGAFIPRYGQFMTNINSSRATEPTLELLDGLRNSML
jgi:hypothetical protein